MREPMQQAHILPDRRSETERLRAENQNLRSALRDLESMNRAEAEGTVAARNGQLTSYNPYAVGTMERIYWATGFANETRHARLADLISGFRLVVNQLDDGTNEGAVPNASRLVEGLVRRYEAQTNEGTE